LTPKSWTTQARKGLLELCILNLLDEGEMYGYDIVKRLTVIPEWQVSGGTIYPILSRLKKDGLVSSLLKESNMGPARKYYRLSKSGMSKCRELNQNWLDLKSALKLIIKTDKKT
jgi:PadR family transcriptional regulator PadR